MIRVATPRFERAVGEAVAAVFVLLLVSIFFAFAVLSMPRQPQADVRSILSVLERMSGESLQLVAFNESAWVVLNIGSYDTSVENLIVLSGDGSLKILTPLNDVGFGGGSGVSCLVTPSRYLRVGSNLTISCVGGYLTGLITTSGRVITMDPKLYTRLVTSESINQTILLESGVVENLINYLENASLLYPESASVKTYGVGLRLVSKETSARIVAEVNASWVFIAKSPEGKWNLLITGHDSQNTARYVEVNGYRYSIGGSSGYYKRYRIVVYGYDGPVTLGTNPITSPTMFRCSTSLCVLKLSGSADSVAFYANVEGVPASTLGFEPYVLTGDISGSGFMSLIFTTIDSTTTGDASTYDDRNSYGGLLDFTQTPLRLVFRNFAINNSKYNVAVLSTKFVFFDDSEVDVEEADNRVVVRLGLYDPQSRAWVYKYELSYYELCRYERFSVTKDFVLRIPTPAEAGSKIYYIAIELIDPFYYSGSRNDLDVTFILEYIGVTLGVRR